MIVVSSTKNFCIVLSKTINTKLIPCFIFVIFGSSAKSNISSILCIIFWICKSKSDFFTILKVKSLRIIFIVGTCNNDIFTVDAIALCVEFTLIKTFFISRANNVIHQNGHAIRIRKVLLSNFGQACIISPADNTPRRINRSAEYISWCLIKEIIAYSSPCSSIVEFNSPLDTSSWKLLIMSKSEFIISCGHSLICNNHLLLVLEKWLCIWKRSQR